MITVTFPDGNNRQYESGTTAAQIAASISKSLEKKAAAAVVDGALADLSDPLTKDVKLELITRDDPRALELIRHDAAHVLAEAVQELFPGTQVTIGPIIENGFYYDFFRNEPFTTADFAPIEKKMKEIISRDKPFTKSTKPAKKQKTFSAPRVKILKSNWSMPSRGTKTSSSTIKAAGLIYVVALISTPRVKSDKPSN